MKSAIVACFVLGMLVSSRSSQASEPGSAQPSHVEADVMARAFPAGGLGASKVADVRIREARELAAKSLGEDMRDLVFVPITPCTVWDTRYASGAPFAGSIASGVTRRFYSHLDGTGGDFTSYGGNPACTEANEAFIGGRPFAAMMTVFVNDPASNGWLTFYRDGDPDPSLATVSVYYSAGPTRTQTVISKSSRGHGAGAYDIAVTGRYSTAHASAAVVGYFLKPVNIDLPHSTASTGNILKGNAPFIHDFGTNNLFVGIDAGNFTMSGDQNTAVGHAALSANAGGFYNTAAGYRALASNTSGSENSAIGRRALESNTTGRYNHAFGAFALNANKTANANVGIGHGALYFNETGTSNIAIGHGAGQNIVLGGNILIGSPGSSSDSQTIRIGSSQTRAFIGGIRGAMTGNANAVPVLIDSLGQLGTASSSRHVKVDIADMGDASSALLDLRPVTFHYRSGLDERDKHLEYGLIAEEVAKVYPGLVAHSPDGQPETVKYQYLPPMLLNEFLKQAARIGQLEQEVAELRREIGRMRR